MDKNTIRTKYLTIRQNIKNKSEQNNLIYQQVVNNIQINQSDLILIYLSFSDEVDTQPIINHYLKSKKIAVPKINGPEMEFYYIDNSTKFQKNQFGILEPVTNNKVLDFQNSVCITPGLCFDLPGNRLGYGHGFYDKFLNQNKIYSIGLCYQECLVPHLPHTKFDHKMDQIITSTIDKSCPVKGRI